MTHLKLLVGAGIICSVAIAAAVVAKKLKEFEDNYDAEYEEPEKCPEEVVKEYIDGEDNNTECGDKISDNKDDETSDNEVEDKTGIDDSEL